MTIRNERPAPQSRPATLRALALSMAVCAAPMTAHASADDVASLYGPQPPADATYLRVINLSTLTAKVALPSGARPVDLGPGAATALDVVRPGASLQVKVDAQALVPQTSSAPVAGPDTVGSTIALAIEHTEAGAWRAVSVAAPPASTDALRAQLRLFNFAEGCDGKVALQRSGAQSGAPVVFEHVASKHAAARSINPVAATLVAVCGDAVSAPLVLPRLAAGQSYSLFLSGPASRPVLRGALDTLDWPRGAR